MGSTVDLKMKDIIFWGMTTRQAFHKMADDVILVGGGGGGGIIVKTKCFSFATNYMLKCTSKKPSQELGGGGGGGAGAINRISCQVTSSKHAQCLVMTVSVPPQWD